jgi:Na+/phosphate symporter
MFGLGSLVALVTMSVSVALTVLVPLVAKGYLRRRQALPYIMGANVTTLGDTLLTALILNNDQATQVVLAELIGVGTITLLLLTFAYRPLTEAVVRTTDKLMSKPRLAIFVGALFCVPLALVYAF